jgi:hypothetical protein
MVLGISWAVAERIFGSRRLPYAVGDNKRMDENIHIGERVKVFLDSKFGNSAGWFDGMVVRIDPYSKHRNFYISRSGAKTLNVSRHFTKSISTPHQTENTQTPPNPIRLTS